MFQLNSQKRILSLGLASAILLMTSACGSQLPEATGLTSNVGMQAQNSSDLGQLVQDFAILSYEEQVDLAENANNPDMKNFLETLANAPKKERQEAIHKTCQGHPDMMQGIRPPRRPGPKGSACGQDNQPPRPDQESDQPHLTQEEFAAEYPELASKLAELKDLEPEARKAAMDSLLEENPDWKEILPPPPQNGEHCGGPRPNGPPPQGPNGQNESNDLS